MTNFGKNIKKIRTIQKLSQAGFGEIFGLSRASIGAYEEGRAEAKLDVIIKIANHFSITVDSLVYKEVTVNELSHFNIFDGDFGGKTQSGGNMLKNIALANIPLISSQELVNREISACLEDTKKFLKLPFLSDKHVAIIIERDSFYQIAKKFSSKDIIIISLDENLWKETDPENIFWLVKSQNHLYLGEVKIGKKNVAVFFPENDAPEHIPLSSIDFFLSVDTHISNKPTITQDENDRLKRLELKVNDLYKRF